MTRCRLGCDHPHAGMIAPPTGSAIASDAIEPVLPQHDMPRAERHPTAFFGGSHERKGRDPQRCRHVQRSGIVAHNRICLRNHRCRLTKIAAFENDHASICMCIEGVDQTPLARPFYGDDIAREVFHHPIG
jgi:hypothetical protein